MKLSIDPVLGRKIVALAAPVVTAMISQTLINQADHILVGRLPASESVPGQAALQISVILLWAVGGALSALSVGTQAITARRLGQGEPLEAGGVLTNALLVAIASSLFFGTLFWFLTPFLFSKITSDAAVIRLGVPFLRWRYVQVFPMVTMIAFKAFFDGLGKTYVHMIAAIAMNVVNFVLNIALIYGKWGFPRMGVEGSGLASCLSSYLGLVIMFGWSLRGELRRKFQYFRVGAISGAVVREVIGLSWPSMAAAFVAMTGFGMFMKIVARLDVLEHHTQPIYQAATANIINIFQLVFISCIAYGTAASTLVGQSMGAKLFDLAEKYVWEAAKIGFLVFAVFGLLTLSFPDVILHIWCKDQAVIDAARPILRLLGALEPIACLALVFMYALYGAGNPRFVMYVELILHFTCLVPIAYLLGPVLRLGLWGSWIAMAVYIVGMAVIMAAKFSTGTWKKITI